MGMTMSQKILAAHAGLLVRHLQTWLFHLHAGTLPQTGPDRPAPAPGHGGNAGSTPGRGSERNLNAYVQRL